MRNGHTNTNVINSVSNRGARPLARHCEANKVSRSNPRTDSGQAPQSIEFIPACRPGGGDCFAEFTLSPSEIASVAFGNLAMTEATRVRPKTKVKQLISMPNKKPTWIRWAFEFRTLEMGPATILAFWDFDRSSGGRRVSHHTSRRHYLDWEQREARWSLSQTATSPSSAAARSPAWHRVPPS